MAPTPKHPLRNVPSPNGSKPSAYSRFIPREELEGFASWQPGAISGKSLGETGQGVFRERRAPPPVPPAPPPAAAPEAPTSEDIAAQLRAARASGYQDGYRDGLVALDGFKQTYAAQITAEVGHLLASIGGQLDELHQDMARALAVTAANLARQVVRSELATRPEMIAQVAEETIDALGQNARQLTLRVHPHDHGLVAQGAAGPIARGQVRLVADTTMARGGCLLTSDVGVIDATLEARWQRAVSSVGCDTPWQPPAFDTPAVTPAAADTVQTTEEAP